MSAQSSLLVGREEEADRIKPTPQEKRDAFAHLKSRATASRPKPKRSPHNLNFRNNLGSYIQNPSTFAPSTVIYHDNDFVYVRDLYPKSFVHTLLLPRDATKSAQHPFDALQDPEFLSAVCRESGNLVRLVSADLRRRFGGQNGRDWEAEVKVGVHMKPSMNHLHIHILSREHYSGCLKHAKHYRSFNTPFFVGLDEFPLPIDDIRRKSGTDFMRSDLVCWRCQKNFGNQFKMLKEHLEEEFNLWKKEPQAGDRSTASPIRDNIAAESAITSASISVKPSHQSVSADRDKGKGKNDAVGDGDDDGGGYETE